MPLSEYHKKRDFTKTSEPSGGVGGKRGKAGRSPVLTYSIQKHQASRLHYDLRLEHNGVLLSWAIPKGPSTDPADKRLAVQTEDHPLEYADFEGTIPKGEYGGGTVLLWDSGSWTPDEDVSKAIKKGHLHFQIHGAKLKGGWHLQLMHGASDKEKNNWLLIKSKDSHATSGRGDVLIEERTESVKSGLELSDIGNGENSLTAGKLQSAKLAQFPQRMKPQLATLATKPPSGANWVHETKYDGYRIMVFCSKDGIILRTRNGHDWTNNFTQIADALEPLSDQQCVIDCELVALDSKGRHDFQLLQNAIKENRSTKVRLRLMAFDLPYAQGYSLEQTPMLERKRLLRLLLRQVHSEWVGFSDHILLCGQTVMETACNMGLEGIISKRVDAGYMQKRTRDWLKSKCSNRQEFIVCGYTDPSGSRKGLGALLLGVFRDDQLQYAGKVGTGFSESTLKLLHDELLQLERKTSPFKTTKLSGAERKGVHWVKPELIAEVKFSGWTQEKHLRHPVFVGLRSDKKPQQVTVEKKVRIENIDTGSATPAARTTNIPLTNPDRVLFPNIHLTKLDLVRYYEAVAEAMLPYVAKRPLSLVRHPRGWKQKGFYQKHVDDTFAAAVKRIKIESKSDNESSDYGYVKDAEGLVALVQMGTLEIHNWGSRIDAVDKPDMIVMDLDPGEGVSVESLMGAAVMLRDLLEARGLKSFLKTTGGKGFHVVIPIRRGPDWDTVKAYCKQLANELMQENPKAFTVKASKQGRRGKIYIDYLRNGRGATAIAPYSSRAREGATVATPVSWDEVDQDLRPDAFTVQNVLQRLKSTRQNPWQDYFKLNQRIRLSED